MADGTIYVGLALFETLSIIQRAQDDQALRDMLKDSLLLISRAIGKLYDQPTAPAQIPIGPPVSIPEPIVASAGGG